MKKFLSILIFAMMIVTAGAVEAQAAQGTKYPELEQTYYRLAVGMKEPVVIRGREAGAKVAWSSDNTKVASVSKDGVITANKAGTAGIKCVYSASGQKMTFCFAVFVDKALTVKPVKAASEQAPLRNIAIGDISYFQTNYHGGQELECSVDDGTLAAVTATKDGLIEIYGLKAGSTYLNVKYGDFSIYKKINVQKSPAELAGGVTIDTVTGKAAPFITLKNTNKLALADIVVRYRLDSELQFATIPVLKADGTYTIAPHAYNSEKLTDVSIDSCRVASGDIPELTAAIGSISSSPVSGAKQYVCLFEASTSTKGAPKYDMFSIDPRNYSMDITLGNEAEKDVMLDKLFICIIDERGLLACDFEVPLDGHYVEAGGKLAVKLKAAGGRIGSSFGTTDSYTATKPMVIFDPGFDAMIGSRRLELANMHSRASYVFTDTDKVIVYATGSFVGK